MDGRIRRYDIRMGKCITDMVSHKLTKISLSMDLKCCLVSCMDDCLRLFDNNNGKLLKIYKGHINHEYSVDSLFANYDNYIVSGSENGDIIFWNLLNSNIINHFKNAHYNSIVTQIKIHPKKSNHMISSDTNGNIKIWK